MGVITVDHVAGVLRELATDAAAAGNTVEERAFLVSLGYLRAAGVETDADPVLTLIAMPDAGGHCRTLITGNASVAESVMILQEAAEKILQSALATELSKIQDCNCEKCRSLRALQQEYAP